MACNFTIRISGPVVAANAQRVALFIQNVSTANVGATGVPSEIAIMGVAPSTTTTYGSQAGIWLAPHNPAQTTIVDTNSILQMGGGSIWQGAVYAVAQSTGGYISECELNP